MTSTWLDAADTFWRTDVGSAMAEFWSDANLWRRTTGGGTFTYKLPVPLVPQQRPLVLTLASRLQTLVQSSTEEDWVKLCPSCLALHLYQKEGEEEEEEAPFACHLCHNAFLQ